MDPSQFLANAQRSNHNVTFSSSLYQDTHFKLGHVDILIEITTNNPNLNRSKLFERLYLDDFLTTQGGNMSLNQEKMHDTYSIS